MASQQDGQCCSNIITSVLLLEMWVFSAISSPCRGACRWWARRAPSRLGSAAAGRPNRLSHPQDDCSPWVSGRAALPVHLFPSVTEFALTAQICP